MSNNTFKEGKDLIKISEMLKELSPVLSDTERLEQDVNLIEARLKGLELTISEMRQLLKTVRKDSLKISSKINQSIEMLMHKIEKSASESIESVQSAPVYRKKEKKEYVPTAGRHGVMIFLSPESDRKSNSKEDSTRITSRLMVPTGEEEKLILNYLITNSYKITKEEYSKVYKEISNMLVAAPKNAIAVELRTAPASKEKKYIELFYHIQVKGKLEFACLKYINIVGVDSYRAMRKKSKKKSQ